MTADIRLWEAHAIGAAFGHERAMGHDRNVLPLACVRHHARTIAARGRTRVSRRDAGFQIAASVRDLGRAKVF